MSESFYRALLVEIRSQTACAYWNVNQSSWIGAAPGDVGYDPARQARDLDPGIPGMRWAWESVGGQQFSFENVGFQWDKDIYRVRVNVEYSPNQWVAWFDRAVATIATWEHSSR